MNVCAQAYAQIHTCVCVCMARALTHPCAARGSVRSLPSALRLLSRQEEVLKLRRLGAVVGRSPMGGVACDVDIENLDQYDPDLELGTRAARQRHGPAQLGARLTGRTVFASDESDESDSQGSSACPRGGSGGGGARGARSGGDRRQALPKTVALPQPTVARAATSQLGKVKAAPLVPLAFGAAVRRAFVWSGEGGKWGIIPQTASVEGVGMLCICSPCALCCDVAWLSYVMTCLALISDYVCVQP